MAETESAIDYTKLKDHEIVAECKTSGAKWAKAFCQHADRHPLKDGGRLDEDWVVGWFANAIETANAYGPWRADKMYSLLPDLQARDEAATALMTALVESHGVLYAWEEACRVFGLDYRERLDPRAFVIYARERAELDALKEIEDDHALVAELGKLVKKVGTISDQRDEYAAECRRLDAELRAAQMKYASETSHQLGYAQDAARRTEGDLRQALDDANKEIAELRAALGSRK